MFGVGAASGRVFHPSDDQTGAPQIAAMSYRAWQNYYASDPSVVGSTFTVNDSPVTVVGVAAPSFFGDRLTQNPPDLWMHIATELVVRSANPYLHRPEPALALSDWSTETRQLSRPTGSEGHRRVAAMACQRSAWRKPHYHARHLIAAKNAGDRSGCAVAGISGRRRLNSPEPAQA